MSDTITVTGIVATPPRHLVTSDGLPITSFRLASQQRYFDRQADAWVDSDTNWYTVTAFRELAEHIAESMEKGQRIVLTGNVRVRSWETEDRTGTTVEILCEAIGHDLRFGTSTFTRIPSHSAEEPESPTAVETIG